MEVRVIAVERELFNNTLNKIYLTWQPSIMISVFLQELKLHLLIATLPLYVNTQLYHRFSEV